MSGHPGVEETGDTSLALCPWFVENTLQRYKQFVIVKVVDKVHVVDGTLIESC